MTERFMILDRPLLTQGEAARLFRRDGAWLYRHRAELEARGFPKPLFRGKGTGALYDPLAILAWRLAQLTPALAEALRGAGASPEDARALVDWEGRLAAASEHIALSD